MNPEQLSQLIDGDDRAWRKFVLRWNNPIFSVVLRTLGSQGSCREEVEDVCQEVFLRLTREGLRLLRRFDPERASFSTWLHLVARSTAVDRLRSQRAMAVPLAEIEEPGITAQTRCGVWNICPCHRTCCPHAGSCYSNCSWKKIAPRQEVADFLKINVQTVHSMKHKALEKSNSLSLAFRSQGLERMLVFLDSLEPGQRQRFLQLIQRRIARGLGFQFKTKREAQP